MKTYGFTDRGLVRRNNQDSYIIAYNEIGDLLAVVCDGIGGGKSGDVASNFIVRYFSEHFSSNKGFNDKDDLLLWIQTNLKMANNQLFAYSTTKKEYAGMGTTFVGLFVTKVGNFVVNIGDSRAYALFSNNVFNQLSEDHTLVQEMINQKEITKEMAKIHEQRHYITNALGVFDAIKIDIFNIVEDVDFFLLCSDGLHGYVDQELINDIACNKKLSSKQKHRILIDSSLAVGGYDNITVVLNEMKGENS